MGDGAPSSSEETADYNDEMIDFEAFLEDDTYMPSAWTSGSFFSCKILLLVAVGVVLSNWVC